MGLLRDIAGLSMGIYEANKASNIWEAEKPIRDAEMKMKKLKFDAEMQDHKLKQETHNMFKNMLQPKMNQVGDGIMNKAKELASSGAGMMAQFGGYEPGGMGTADTLAAAQEVQPGVIDDIVSQQSGGGQPPGGGGGGQPNAMAKGLDEILSDPNKLAALKVMGFDLTGAANVGIAQDRFGETQRHNLETEGLGRERFERGAGEVTYQNAYNSQTGATDRMPIPKYGNQPTLAGKPLEHLMPIKDTDRPLYIHKDSGEYPPPGMTPKQAQEDGYIRVQGTQTEKLRKINAVQDIISEVESIMERTIPKKEVIGRLGGLGREISSRTQFTEKGQDLAVMKSFINGNKAQVAKALGEVGNLSESEQEAVIELFGSITDSGPKAWKQFELLKKTFNKAKSTALGLDKEDISFEDMDKM